MATLSPFLYGHPTTTPKQRPVDIIQMSLVACYISLLSCYLPVLPLRPKRQILKSSFSAGFTILVFRNDQKGHLATFEDWIKTKTMEKKYCFLLGDFNAESINKPLVTFLLDVSL